MNKNIHGIEKIVNKIISEAESYAENEKNLAIAKAEEIINEQRKLSAVKSEDIISKAKTEAAALTENAESNADTRKRNALLALKSDMCDKAFDTALEKFSHLPEEAYVEALSKLLVQAVNNTLSDEDTAELCMNEKDMGFADKIIGKAAPLFAKKTKVAKGQICKNIKSGFILDCGHIEINCSGEAIIKTSRSHLEKNVLDLLFS